MKNCKLCLKPFNKKPSDSQKYWLVKLFCSKKCSNDFNREAQANSLRGVKRPLEIVKKMQATMFKKGHQAWNKHKIFTAILGSKNHNWKGDTVGYTGLHMWVYKHLGKPDTCEYCGIEGLEGHQIHWANKSHEYKRDIKDWLRLCAKCHAAYDRQ